MTLDINDSRKCEALIILEDDQPEVHESLLINIEELGTYTQVIILDDDGM